MHSLAMHWDGTRWRVASTPGLNPVLNGVVAVSGENVWTTGGWTDIGGGSWIARQLDLGGRTVSSSPDPTQQRAGDSYLGGIAARSADDIWIVGSTANRKDEGGPELDPHKPLVQHWDATAWSIVPSPIIDQQESGLAAVVTISNNIWAVGYHGNSTLVMRFVRSTDAPCATPVSETTNTPRPNDTPAANAASLPITNSPTVAAKATAKATAMVAPTGTDTRTDEPQSTPGDHARPPVAAPNFGVTLSHIPTSETGSLTGWRLYQERMSGPWALMTRQRYTCYSFLVYSKE